MSVAHIARVKDLLSGWQQRTDEVLRKELKRMGIGVTDDLYTDLKHEMEERLFSVFYLELVMRTRGRMVDMGVGRGVPLERVKVQRYKSRGAKRRRRPKKWYSPPFYGRLNDLQGVIGMKMIEEAQSAIRGAFD